MLDERELLNALIEPLDEDRGPEFRDMKVTDAPSDAAAQMIELLDGTTFLVTVVKVKEAE